jgi:hypothetical protein
MPQNPADYGFFQPMGGPTPTPGLGDPSTSPLRVKAGYKNIYGTDAGVTFDPLSGNAGINAKIPIGDHQRQLFFGVDAYGNPMNKDWGAQIKLTKRIAPQAPTAGEALNAITGSAFSQQKGGANGAQQAAYRQSFMNTLTPEQLQLLHRGVRQYQREEVDRQLGIVPGAEKYSLSFGVGGDQLQQQRPIGMVGVPGMIDGGGDQQQEQEVPIEGFPLDYAKRKGLIQ